MGAASSIHTRPHIRVTITVDLVEPQASRTDTRRLVEHAMTGSSIKELLQDEQRRHLEGQHGTYQRMLDRATEMLETEWRQVEHEAVVKRERIARIIG